MNTTNEADKEARLLRKEKEALMKVEEEKKRREDVSETTEEIVQPEKLSWWKRFRQRRDAKSRELQEKLRRQTSLQEGLPLEPKAAPPFVALGELADSSINITVRAWTVSSDYWGLFFDMNQRFYTELPQHGFSFPFPQLDVHMVEN